MNILLYCAAFFVLLLLLCMDENVLGANAVVLVLPMATAVARAAVDRENFMIVYVRLLNVLYYECFVLYMIVFDDSSSVLWCDQIPLLLFCSGFADKSQAWSKVRGTVAR